MIAPDRLLHNTAAMQLLCPVCLMPGACLSCSIKEQCGASGAGAAVISFHGVVSVPQVLTFTAVVMPNQDLAFMGAIAWTAVNLLMSNFMVRYVDIGVGWFSQLR